MKMHWKLLKSGETSDVVDTLLPHRKRRHIKSSFSKYLCSQLLFPVLSDSKYSH